MIIHYKQEIYKQIAKSLGANLADEFRNTLDSPVHTHENLAKFLREFSSTPDFTASLEYHGKIIELTIQLQNKLLDSGGEQYTKYVIATHNLEKLWKVVEISVYSYLNNI